MSITDEVRRVAHESLPPFAEDPTFVALQQFYRRMKEAGLVKQRQYDLPPLDTIGRDVVRQPRARRNA
jgi:hypothetical protein